MSTSEIMGALNEVIAQLEANLKEINEEEVDPALSRDKANRMASRHSGYKAGIKYAIQVCSRHINLLADEDQE